MSTLTLGGSTLASKSGSVLSLDSGVTFPGPPTGADGGHILQIKSATKTDDFSTYSGTYTDVPGMSVDITPTSSSNKIFVMIHLQYGGTVNLYANAKVLRDTTVVSTSTAVSLSNQINSTFAFSGDNDNFAYKVNSTPYHFLDSPSSTSALTYKLQVMTNDTSRTIYINRPEQNGNYSYISGGTSSITVMEVQG